MAGALTYFLRVTQMVKGTAEDLAMKNDRRHMVTPATSSLQSKCPLNFPRKDNTVNGSVIEPFWFYDCFQALDLLFRVRRQLPFVPGRAIVKVIGSVFEGFRQRHNNGMNQRQFRSVQTLLAALGRLSVVPLVDCRLDQVSKSPNLEVELFFLCLGNLLPHWGFHSSSDNEKSSGNKGGDGEAKVADCCAASLTSSSPWLSMNLAIGSMILSSFARAFTIAETIGSHISTWMTAVSKVYQTLFSFTSDVSIKRVSLPSDAWTNAMLSSSSKFSTNPIRDFLKTYMTRAYKLPVSWLDASSIMLQTSDRFTGYSGASLNAKRFTIRLFWSKSILSNASSGSLDICSTPSNVFFLRSVGQSLLILNGEGTIALPVRRSGLSTVATSCRIDLGVLNAISKFQPHLTLCIKRY